MSAARHSKVVTVVVLVAAGLAFAGVREQGRSCRSRGGETVAFGISCVGPRLGDVWRDMAGNSRLAIDPSSPRAGDVLTVVYEAPSRLASHDRLHLRGRSPLDGGDYQYQTVRTLAVLERAGNGFRGMFRLPEDVAYMQVSVESVDGRTIDTNAGLTWEVVVHESDGRPSYTALVARARSNWESDALRLQETGRLLQALAPRRPWGAYARAAAEDRINGLWGQDVTRGRLARAYRSMYADLRDRPGLEVDDLVALVDWSSRILDDSRDEWRDRLMREYPTSPSGRQLRSTAAWSVTADDARAGLDSILGIWGDLDPDDAELAARASGRVFSTPALLIDVVEQYNDVPAHHLAFAASVAGDEAGAAPRRRALQKRAADRAFEPIRLDRPLTDTEDEFARVQAEWSCGVASRVAGALLDQGAVAEAQRIIADTRTVIGTEPCPFALQVRAALRLRAGDPVGAISDWTELAARSPERRSAYADSIRRVSSRFDSTGWYERVEEREREQWLRTLAEPVRTPEGETSLVEANGQIVPLTTMLAEGPLVVMLTTEAGLRDQAAQTVKAMASGVSPLSIRWITVVRGSPHPIALPDTSMASILPAYFDLHGELGEAVGQRRMHEYIVFDTGGRIRYQTGNAYLARRRAVLLTTVR